MNRKCSRRRRRRCRAATMAVASQDSQNGRNCQGCDAPCLLDHARRASKSKFSEYLQSLMQPVLEHLNSGLDSEIAYSQASTTPHESAISSTAPSSSSDEYEPNCMFSLFSWSLARRDPGERFGEPTNRQGCQGTQLSNMRLSGARKSGPLLLFLGFASGDNTQPWGSRLTAACFRLAKLGAAGSEPGSSGLPFAADLLPAFLKRMPHALQRDFGPPGPFLQSGVLEVPQWAHTCTCLSASCMHRSTLDAAVLPSATALCGRLFGTQGWGLERLL